MSSVHTSEDIDKTINAAAFAFDEVSKLKG